jgi:transposase
MRHLLDGLFDLVRTGCQRRHLPPPPIFPPWRTVYGYMRAFTDAGVWESMRHHLVMMLRERDGREASPTAAILDTQSVKTTEKQPCWRQVCEWTGGARVKARARAPALRAAAALTHPHPRSVRHPCRRRQAPTAPSVRPAAPAR